MDHDKRANRQRLWRGTRRRVSALPAPPALMAYWDQFLNIMSKEPTVAHEFKPMETQHCVRYEINVSYKGLHVFATERWLRAYSEKHIAALVRLFGEKFTPEEGFKVSVASFTCAAPLGMEIETALQEIGTGHVSKDDPPWNPKK